MDSNVADIIGSLVLKTKRIDIKDLPTQGFFYQEDFTLSIRRASFDDILLYNFNYIFMYNITANM